MWLAIRHWAGLVFRDDKIRPFDWLMLLIEVLVLAVIAYEAIYRPWKVHRWLKAVFRCFSKGQALERSVPASYVNGVQVTEDVVNTWNNLVSDWINETWSVLHKYSPQATAAFSQDRLQA